MDTPPPGTPHAAGGVSQDPGVEVVLHAQRLLVTTERVVTERVRFTKRVVTTTRTVEVPVRVEQLVISREPAQGVPAVVDAASTGRTDGDEFVVVLHEEVPEVTLRVVPVERVSVAVRTVAGEHVVSADLAAERLDVELDVVSDHSSELLPRDL